jgi:hypothetical protein
MPLKVRSLGRANQRERLSNKLKIVGIILTHLILITLAAKQSARALLQSK